MPRSLALELLARLEALGTLHVTLTGGEPTLHADLEEILWEARRRDLVIKLATNGTRITQGLVQTLRAVNAGAVQVTLYSLRPEVHDSITGLAGSFELCRQAIGRLCEADVPVQVACPLTTANAQGVEALARWCARMGLPMRAQFVLTARADCDQGNLAGRLPLTTMLHLVRAMADASQDAPAPMGLAYGGTAAPRSAGEPTCGAGVGLVCVSAQGSVHPCSALKGVFVGHVRDDSLGAIWGNSPALERLRAITTASFPECADCDAAAHCHMCLARNHNESGGDLLAPSPYGCAVARVVTEVVRERAGRPLGSRW